MGDWNNSAAVCRQSVPLLLTPHGGLELKLAEDYAAKHEFFSPLMGDWNEGYRIAKGLLHRLLTPHGGLEPAVRTRTPRPYPASHPSWGTGTIEVPA